MNILWLMPINPLGEKMRKGTLGSPYAVRDYYAINPDYGTEADLKRLISEAHQRGLKVIIDIVANHTAWDSVLMQHPEFYKQDASGKIIPPVKDWTDVAGLNYANPELREYMIAMLKHWIDPATFDLDGFRCDVASEVPTDFWEQARAELTKVKPDIILLAEASKPDLLVNAFDLDYSWPLHSALNDVLLRGAPASELQRSWEESRQAIPAGLPAPALLRQPRRSPRHRPLRLQWRPGRLGLHVHARRRPSPLQRHGSRRRHRIRRPGPVREDADLLAFQGPPALPRHLPGPDPPAPAIPGLLATTVSPGCTTPTRQTWSPSCAWTTRTSSWSSSTSPTGPSAPRWTSSSEPRSSLCISPGLPDAPANDFPLFRLKGFEWRIYHGATK